MKTFNGVIINKCTKQNYKQRTFISAGCQSAVEAEYECDKMSDSVPIDDEESTPLEEWRIVLIGKTGVGKSKSANSILGTQVFKSELSGVSVTQKSQIGRANRFGKKILLVDTPGIFDTKIPMPSIWKEIAKCIGLTSPGLHAIIFVVQVDRYTDEDQQTVDMFLKRFGEDSIGFLIVLFTRKDDLKRNKKPFNEFIDSLDKESNIAKLIQRCSKRCIAFDNFCSPEENDAQVRELFTLIGSVISKNEGGMYSNKMYEAAEEEFRRIEEEELAKMEIEREEEIKKIRKRGAKGKKDPNYQQKQIVAIEEKYKKKKKIPIREHIQDQCVEEKSGIFARILRILRSYFSGK